MSVEAILNQKEFIRKNEAYILPNLKVIELKNFWFWNRWIYNLSQWKGFHWIQSWYFGIDYASLRKKLVTDLTPKKEVKNDLADTETQSTISRIVQVCLVVNPIFRRKQIEEITITEAKPQPDPSSSNEKSIAVQTPTTQRDPTKRGHIRGAQVFAGTGLISERNLLKLVGDYKRQNLEKFETALRTNNGLSGVNVDALDFGILSDTEAAEFIKTLHGPLKTATNALLQKPSQLRKDASTSSSLPSSRGFGGDSGGAIVKTGADSGIIVSGTQVALAAQFVNGETTEEIEEQFKSKEAAINYVEQRIQKQQARGNEIYTDLKTLLDIGMDLENSVQEINKKITAFALQNLLKIEIPQKEEDDAEISDRCELHESIILLDATYKRLTEQARGQHLQIPKEILEIKLQISQTTQAHLTTASRLYTSVILFMYNDREKVTNLITKLKDKFGIDTVQKFHGQSVTVTFIKEKKK